jgi:hypothetical protein
MRAQCNTMPNARQCSTQKDAESCSNGLLYFSNGVIAQDGVLMKVVDTQTTSLRKIPVKNLSLRFVVATLLRSTDAC